jgi:NADPH:quinone reductase-like Zn-dependent oxidoreductase
MNAAVVQSFSTPPRYTSFADPIPAEGERLVQVTAAGLHPIVRGLASGSHYGSGGELPIIPGLDGTGRLEDGSRVYFGSARSPFGTFAELSLAGPTCLPLPEALDDATAAALANPGMSSWAALTARARFVAGESVLILGATGVAGHLAVQIAKRLGARRVVAAGRNPQALEEAQALGADAIIPLDQDRDALVQAFRREIAESGVDVVLDYLWGAPAEAVLEAIAQKGLSTSAPRIRYLEIGESAGKTVALPGATLRSSGLELLGSGFGSASMPQLRQAIGELFQSAAQQPFHLNIRTAPLKDVESLWNTPEKATRFVFQP